MPTSAEIAADIREDDIFALAPDLLATLLVDRTLSTAHRTVNIFWATDNYASRGPGYAYTDPITIPCITGANGTVIVPRALKPRALQQQRSRQMAEVFTPSWICNRQNNLVDDAWFGRPGVFNTEVDNPDGTHTWTVSPEPVTFPEGKTWKDYVRDTRLEITCGEAPYLTSRYDTVTGEPIPVERRIGLLDRKLRVVSENCPTPGEWLRWAKFAVMNIYGFEWQGDNLLLAREAVLMTYIEHFRHRFGHNPGKQSLRTIAYIISWNLWQMDGLKGVVPGTCHDTVEESLFATDPTISSTPPKPCPGCRKKDITRHNGRYCLLKDWNRRGDGSIGDTVPRVRFIDLLK